jgi:hypoxanthine phosphoribosyltransferase
VSADQALPAQSSRPSFAHASEAELARILDFYDVRWSYEPDTFPIGWTLDGDVVESFSPDFYLPDLDLYVELTTLKQSLVRKKNRKLRRLRELYPDVRIKLFYARDFRQLLLKFGRLALAEELSGTTGQATPPRVHAAPEAVDPSTGGGAASPDAEEPVGADTNAGSTPAPGSLPAGDAEAGRSSRGRRRGRRRRAAARAAALAASTAPYPAGAAPHAAAVTVRGPGAVPSAGTYPA